MLAPAHAAADQQAAVPDERGSGWVKVNGPTTYHEITQMCCGCQIPSLKQNRRSASTFNLTLSLHKSLVARLPQLVLESTVLHPTQHKPLPPQATSMAKTCRMQARRRRRPCLFLQAHRGCLQVRLPSLRMRRRRLRTLRRASGDCGGCGCGCVSVACQHARPRRLHVPSPRGRRRCCGCVAVACRRR